MQELIVKTYEKKALTGRVITCGPCNTPFGQGLAGRTEEGLCWLAFPSEERPQEDLLADMVSRFRGAKVIETKESVVLHGPIVLYGTAFQQTVWRALREIPEGRTTTYGTLAREIGKPTAPRAVGQAIGANPVALYIPCHRVLGAHGALGGYAWGVGLKKRILKAEGAL